MGRSKIVNWVNSVYKLYSAKAKHISLPGFEKVPIYNVGVFYKNGLSNGAIGVRASAISFNFFVALFPGIIFLFSLIPFIPIPGFQIELTELIKQILPSNTYMAIEKTIIDITTNKRVSLLSFGFIAALFFSTNGVSNMIAAFNATANAFENRSWISTRVIGMPLVLVLVILTTIGTGLIIFGKYILKYLVTKSIIHNGFSQVLFISGQWLIILFVAYVSISLLYYFAPSKRDRYKFFSPGSTVATILIILTSLAFSYYLSHFGRYNKLFGSIGTLIALLIWLNINAFVLLIGFELNVSIRNARLFKKNKLELSQSSQEYEKFYPKKEDLLKDLQ
ncbi:MAG: YihY/virulence factor BrkB family protein [Salinivirgaceae bacterium]|nr:YihY/virulence factor BrkB family protein [Salinivirgaceae bacterium]